MLADLADATAQLDTKFDVVAMAGNVMIFVDAGTEGQVSERAELRCWRAFRLLVPGFSHPARQVCRWPTYDRWRAAAGLESAYRWADLGQV